MARRHHDGKIGGAAKVLVVDDDPTSLFILDTILSKEGLTVVKAADGEQAVAAAERERFDLVLIDLNMPRLCGLEATRRIRARAGAAGAPPVVAVTANATAQAREDCREAGMVDFLTKPVDLEHLLAVLADHVGELPIQRERSVRAAMGAARA